MHIKVIENEEVNDIKKYFAEMQKTLKAPTIKHSYKEKPKTPIINEF